MGEKRSQEAKEEQKEFGAFSEETDYEVPGSYEGRVPGWLKWTYFILPIWGIVTWHIYFNGSAGWLDRGYWKQLQIAANTTFPVRDQDLQQPEDQGNRAPASAPAR